MLKLVGLSGSMLIVAAVVAGAPANAAAFGPVKAGIFTEGLIKVADGCGFRRHYSPRLGRCVWNWRGY